MIYSSILALTTISEDYPELSNIIHMKDYDKLRIIDTVLEIDNRSFICISRYLSGDNRWTTLKYFSNLISKYGKTPQILYFLNKLEYTTYKNDKKWIDKLNSVKAFLE